VGEEDIVDDVFGFEHVATDGAVGGGQVALVSRVDDRDRNICLHIFFRRVRLPRP
jgi:hypothetical protein